MMTLKEIDEYEQEFIEEVSRSDDGALTKMKKLFSASDLLNTAREAHKLKAEIEALDKPEVHDFLKGIEIEAVYQRKLWGKDCDSGKKPTDWFWLIGYLSGKALACQISGDVDKALHHAVTTAAACCNWHAAIRGKTNMRPGIADPE